MSTLAIITVFLATVVAMEFVAWASHKYIMHGFGWAWHRDHHEPHDRVLEKNDLFAIVGAEYVLRMLPRGTHEFAKFIRPAELGGWIRDAGLDLQDITGLTYNPLTRTYKLGADVDVNYMVHCQREAQA